MGCVSRSCPLCPYLASGANRLVLLRACPATSPFTPGDPAAGTLVRIGPTTAPPQRSSCARIVGALGHAFSPLAHAGVGLQPHRSYCRTSVLRPNSASKVPGPRPCTNQPSALSAFAGGLWAFIRRHGGTSVTALQQELCRREPSLADDAANRLVLSASRALCAEGHAYLERDTLCPALE